MRKTFIAPAILAGSLLAAAAANSDGGQEMTDDQLQALATVEIMTANLERGDIDGVMATYAEGAAIMFEPGSATTDPEVARQIFAELAAVKPQVSYAGHEVFVSGDIAVHISPWSMTGTAPDGTEVAQGGLSVAVLRRQADGSWKMVIDNPHGGHLLAQ